VRGRVTHTYRVGKIKLAGQKLFIGVAVGGERSGRGRGGEVVRGRFGRRGGCVGVDSLDVLVLALVLVLVQ
jgi:hypothetical protein